MRQWLPAVLFLAPVFIWCFASAANNSTDELERHRNLGKAFYENPTTQKEAVTEFQRALQLNPSSARERLNYGLALLRAGRTPEGVAELDKVQKQDASLPHTWFNLAIVHKKAGETDKALAQMQGFAKLVPDEPISLYNIGALYKASGQMEKATGSFERASQLDPGLAAAHFQLYNLYRTAGRADDAKRELARFQELKKQQEGAAIPEDVDWNAYAEVLDVMGEGSPADATPQQPRYETRRLPGAARGGVFIDPLGDGHVKALTWSEDAIRLESETPVATLKGIRNVIPGDFNNDGLPDLCVLTDAGPVLLANSAGKFAAVNVSGMPKGSFSAAVWVDYDHDYDLDLFLFGSRSVLLRNAGQAGFQDRSSDFPFDNRSATAATAVRVIADTRGFDIIASYATGEAVLYRDQLQGRYRAEPLSLPAGVSGIRPVDLNGDGYFDLLLETQGSTLQALNNRRGGFGKASETKARTCDAADRNEDGREDLLCVENGVASLLTNVSPARSFLRVRLAGVRNLKSAPMAEVEVKAGLRYAKRLYTGVPLLFDLGTEKTADTVRITWPNGLVQNEIRQAAGKGYNYAEAQRLSGSCPMVWTWNGKGFQFITDVLGVAPLGASTGDGKYFPVDDEENIQIPADSLIPRADGLYEIRITEELSEVAYLDRIRLLAVDHAASSSTLVNEKFQSPPYPPLEIYDAHGRVAPVRARDGSGRNVLTEVLRRDHVYPTGFRRAMTGVAETHTLDLDFGHIPLDSKRQMLVLNGWVDWADGSTFLGAAQEGKGGLMPPQLQVRDQRGEWVTVLEDMGIPAGKPKTIAVDLTGKWRSNSREVRIVTNLCVYWDEIWLSTDVRGAGAIEVPLQTASLAFRGFSPNEVDPRRLQPEQFRYDGARPFSMWNPTPGLYTRYGDVTPLARSADNLMIVMGSGDELRLVFDPRSLPVPKPGMKRDFVLSVGGWAKDRDANTADSQTVEPLPFHGMSAYPYGSAEHFPDTPETRDWRARYQTRPALRLNRPLLSSVARP